MKRQELITKYRCNNKNKTQYGSSNVDVITQIQSIKRPILNQLQIKLYIKSDILFYLQMLTSMKKETYPHHGNPPEGCVDYESASTAVIAAKDILTRDHTWSQ